MMKALCGMLLVVGMLFSIANVTTEGGNVTELFLNTTQNSSYWDGFYGDVVLGAGFVYTEWVTGNNISLLNIDAQDPPCTYSSISMRVVAANASPIALVLPLAAGDLSILDLMILDCENGSSTFTATSSFALTYGTYNNVPSLYTLANGTPSPYFREGYLNDANNNLVFVADVVDDRPNWNGTTSDYQIMLPNNGSAMQYWLWVDVLYTCVTPPGPGHKDHELFIFPIGTYEVVTGGSFDAEATVRNRGDYTEDNVLVFVDDCPAGFSCGSLLIPKIKEGEEEDVLLQITAGAIGQYVLTVCAENEDADYCREFILNVLPECETDDDCGEDEYCEGGICEPKKEEGEECESDAECLSGVCSGGVCVPCETDGDCADDEVCTDGYCEKVECPCGVVENHVCVPYECCEDSDCKVDEFCISHFCVEKEIELLLIDGTRVEGDTGFFQVLNNKGEEVGGADVFTDDEGTVSDENGYASLAFPYGGIVYAYAEGYGQIAKLYDIIKLGFINVEGEFAVVGKETIIRIADSRGNPIAGATVIIEGESLISDGNGEVRYVFETPGPKEIRAHKMGYLINDGEITVGLVPPVEEEVCRFPVLLNWIEIPITGLPTLWLIAIVLGIFNFLTFGRRIKGDLLEKLLKEKKHDYEGVLKSKRREQYIASIVYSFAPVVLAVPNIAIFSICFMLNIVVLQAIGEIILVIKSIGERKL